MNSDEVKNLTAHRRLLLRKSVKLASYSDEKCSSSSPEIDWVL